MQIIQITIIINKLNVEEIALGDDPTAAAMGAGVPPGSKLLGCDLGGSTIDLAMVSLEGGEGKAAPIAELIRFNGKDLSKKSRQIMVDRFQQDPRGPNLFILSLKYLKYDSLNYP